MDVWLVLTPYTNIRALGRESAYEGPLVAFSPPLPYRGIVITIALIIRMAALPPIVAQTNTKC